MTRTNTPQSHLSLGTLLSEKRNDRSIPLEKAAKDTRMRTQRLREIEADDFSQFGSPSYARMFILAYARYLGIPLAEIQDRLPEPGACSSEGFQYLSAFGKDYPQLRTGNTSRAARRQHRSGALPVIVKTFAAVATVTAVGIGIFLSINIPRLMADRSFVDMGTETPVVGVDESPIAPQVAPEIPAAAPESAAVTVPVEHTPPSVHETARTGFFGEQRQAAASLEVLEPAAVPTAAEVPQSLTTPTAGAALPTLEDDRSLLLIGVGISATIQ